MFAKQDEPGFIVFKRNSSPTHGIVTARAVIISHKLCRNFLTMYIIMAVNTFHPNLFKMPGFIF